MHDSTMAFLRRVAGLLDLEGKYVIEVGSMICGDSPRKVFQDKKLAKYLGIDMRPGAGVDRVLRCENLIGALGHDVADLVVCCGTLEHMENWSDCLANMVFVLKPGGHFLLTVPAPGFPRHNFPNDYWRFTHDNVRAIGTLPGFETVIFEEDPEQPGSMLLAKRVEARNDYEWGFVPQEL